MIPTIKKERLTKEFCDIINKLSIENYGNIPDYMLAEYAVEAIENLMRLVAQRDTWFGFKPFGEKITPAERYCKECGSPESNHPYRHPFSSWTDDKDKTL